MKDCLQLHLVSNQNVVHSQGVDVTHYLTGASMQSVSLVWRLLPVEVGLGLTVHLPREAFPRLFFKKVQRES